MASIDNQSNPDSPLVKREPVWVEDHGLTLLFEPAERIIPLADVVFVHGLQGHPYRTWRFKGKVEKRVYNEAPERPTGHGFFANKPRRWRTEVSQNTVFWPGELLPDDVPNVRIFTFGYDSHVTHGIHGPANRSNIFQHGLTLLNAVSDVRHDDPARPLIFVAHSLGGLLVKQALVESEKAAKDGQERNLHKECKAVMFFGTPHRGSSDAAWGTIMANIARAVQFNANTSILTDLDPSNNSPTLEVLRADFNGLMMRESIKVYTFQEAAGKSGLNAVSTKVVTDESSSFDFRNFEVREYINQNHLNMCRFQSRDDDGYRKSLGAIRYFLSALRKGKGSGEVTCERNEEARQVLLENLDFAERNAREAQIENAEIDASTIDWIWNMEGGQSLFKKWLQDDNPIFWIQGKPGSGKSTIMRQLSSRSSEVTNILNSNPHSQGSWRLAKFFFDFRADTGVANNIEGLIRSLCLQIIEEFPEMHFERKELLEWQKTILALEPLKQMLAQLLQRLSENLCIFVDGLDEFHGKIPELLGFLRTLSHKDCGHRKLKMCLASRPEPVITLTLSDLPGLVMQEHNRVGVERYIRNAIENLELSPSDRSELLKLSTYIAIKAEGMFLWARLALHELIDSYAAGESLNELEVRLDTLPSSMEELYSRLFKRMKPQDRNNARLIFQLISSAAAGGDRVRCIQEAEAIVIDRPEGSLENFRKRLKARTVGLLEEVDEEKVSVREDELPVRRTQPINHVFHTNVRKHQLPVLKTIHRSVNHFLEREGWLKGLEINGQTFHTPAALRVYVGCKNIEQTMSYYFSSYCEQNTTTTVEGFGVFLYDHMLQEFFSYARAMEHYEGSAFRYLQIVSDISWAHFSFATRSIMKPPRTHGLDNAGNERSYITRECLLDEDAITNFRMCQSWQIMVEQRLILAVEDALTTGKYKVSPDQDDISLAIQNAHDIGVHTVVDKHLQPRLHQQLLPKLLERGARPGTGDIIRCLAQGDVPILEFLLRSYPRGRLKLDKSSLYVPNDWDDTRKLNYTYEGNEVGPLWELARVGYGNPEFASILDFFLARGERLDDVCGPWGGTIVHALVYCDEYLSLARNLVGLQKVIERGADLDIKADRGTPIQMAWDIAHYCENGVQCRRDHQFMVRFLIGNGAEWNVIEPDGTVVDPAQVAAFCLMNDEQMAAQCQPRYEFPGWYTWRTLTSEEQVTARSSLWDDVEQYAKRDISSGDSAGESESGPRSEVEADNQSATHKEQEPESESRASSDSDWNVEKVHKHLLAKIARGEIIL